MAFLYKGVTEPTTGMVCLYKCEIREICINGRLYGMSVQMGNMNDCMAILYKWGICKTVCLFLFDLILYVHSTIFQLCGTGLPGLNQY